MALTQDLTRGALLVGGMSYPIMIGRSVDFYDYEILYRVWYPRRFDRELLMHVMISMWDYAEPNAWLPHVLHDTLPDTPAKQILYQVARHDSQVPNISSDAAVRTMGLQQLAPGLLDIWGVDEAEGPLDSALVYYDLDREPPPAGNEAPTEGNGAHGDQRWLPAAMEQMSAFWQPDGQVISFCEGPCDPE